MSRTSLKSSFSSLGPIVLFHYCLSYGQHNDEYQNEDPQCMLFRGNMVLVSQGKKASKWQAKSLQNGPFYKRRYGKWLY